MKTTTIIVLAFVAMVLGTFMLAEPTLASPTPNDYQAFPCDEIRGYPCPPIQDMANRVKRDLCDFCYDCFKIDPHGTRFTRCNYCYHRCRH